MNFNSSFRCFFCFRHTLFGQTIFLSFYLQPEKITNKSHSKTKQKKYKSPKHQFSIRLDMYFVRMCRFFLSFSIFLSFSRSLNPSDAHLCLLLVFFAWCMMPYACCCHNCLNECWDRLRSSAWVCASQEVLIFFYVPASEPFFCHSIEMMYAT